MKKRLLVLLVISLLVLTACGKSEDVKNTDTKNNGEENVQTVPENGDEEKTEQQDKLEETENIINTMSSEEKREMNLFLSNFSEAFYNPVSGFYRGDEAKIDFAFTHITINSSEKVVAEDYYMGITAEDIDIVLNRFFGESIPHKTPENSKRWVYKNGKFLVPAASGDSYGNFSIVTEVRVLKDGNYEALFNVYNDPEIVGGDIITDKTIYSLTDSEASDRYVFVERGKAVLKPKTHNGKQTYELVHYIVEKEAMQ